VVLDGEKGSGRAKLAQAVGQYVNPDKNLRMFRVDGTTNGDEILTRAGRRDH
jgi:hypothetical protein